MVYVDCLDGYERNLIGGAEKNPGFCLDGELCWFSAFPPKPVTIKFVARNNRSRETRGDKLTQSRGQ